MLASDSALRAKGRFQMRFVMKSKALFTLGNPDKYRSREMSGFGKGLNRYTVS